MRPLTIKEEYTVKKNTIITIVTLAMLLTGCGAQYPLTTNLSLEVSRQPAGIYHGDTTATLQGHDTRKDSAVVAYQLKGDPEIRIPNETEPHALVTNLLARGLIEQGLVFEGGAPVRIQLNLDELMASVTRPKFLYSTKARSHLNLTITNREITLTKAYDRETNRDSATRPPVQDLEKMLNDQLTDIVKQILQDEEVRTAISKK